MREIKFRAWDKTSKKMYDVDSFDCARTPPYYFSPLLSIDESGIPSAGMNINRLEADFVLMQYTGLKDKNGKEIYEGDIVKDSTNDVIWVVIWDEEAGGWGNKVKYPDYCLFKSLEKSFEVIGNIKENPELLTKKKDL